MTALIVVLAVVVVFVIAFTAIYNGLVRLKKQVENSWSQIDVQLKRRHDLIPNLVETAKGYMAHERDTLENITKARNLATGAKGAGDAGKAEAGLSQALSNFFVVVENYPDLKASQNFLGLQEELSSTENKISFARQFYNDCVMRYNTKTEVIPSNIIASMAGFKPEEFFEIEDAAEREVTKVSFT